MFKEHRRRRRACSGGSTILAVSCGPDIYGGVLKIKPVRLNCYHWEREEHKVYYVLNVSIISA